MKKFVAALVLLLILSFSIGIPVFAEGNDDWAAAPVITSVYEQNKGKVTVEWDGNSVLYQVYVDGKNVATVNIESATIDLKDGLHQIIVLPITYESKNANTNVEFEIASIAGGSIDLGSLGVDPKDLFQGSPSKTFKFNYTASPIMNAVPEILGVATDFQDRIVLSFTDKYDSDIYRIAVKSGKDINYVDFDTSAKDAASLLKKVNSTVTVTLDQKYLKAHGCMIPELDQKYGFSVKLQKWPVNLIDGSKEPETVIESKDSKVYDYTPYAAWKNAPEITYASQTAEGQITLRWSHEDNGLGCTYKVLSLDKILVVKKDETVLGTTSKKEFVVNDLMNGKHNFAIVPIYGRESGISSDEAVVELKNNWVVAPALSCESAGKNQVKLKWTSPEQIESYHVTVYAGSGSLLRFVNLDYKKYQEFDVPATPGKMEYTFHYDQNTDPENGTKLKFEIYGIRHAANGAEQKSSTSAQTITIR